MTSTVSHFDVSQKLPVSKITRPVAAPKSTFTKFGLDYSKLLSDDYVHKKFLTVKYTGKGYYFTVNGKGSLDFKLGADKKEQPVTSSEIKLTTNIEGRNLETRFDNKGLIRVWGNIGTYTFFRPVIVTGKVKTNNAFNRLSGNVCLEYQLSQGSFLTRLDLKDGNIPYVSEKLILNVDRFQLGFATKLNLLNYNLARYNFFAAYNEKNFGIVAEHVSRNKTKIELGRLALATTLRRGGNDYVVKASYRPYKVDQIRVKLGTVHNLNNNTTLRAKVNNNGKLTLASRIRYNSNLSLVAGTQINLLNPGSFTTGRVIPIPLGINVELSY